MARFNKDKNNRDEEHPSYHTNNEENHSSPMGQEPSRIVRTKGKRKKQRDNTSLGKISVSRDNSLILSESVFQYLLNMLYRNLYYVGITVLRKGKSIRRRGKRWISTTRGSFRVAKTRIATLFSRWKVNLQRRLLRPFVQIRQVTVKERKASTNGKISVKGFFRIIRGSFGYVWRIIRTLLSYVLPVIAVFVLISSLEKAIHVPKALEVKYHGELIGYVEHERNFTQAMNNVNKRLATVDDIVFSQAAPEFQFITITPALLDKVITPKIENQIVREENNRARMLARTQKQSGGGPETTPKAKALTREDIQDLSGKVKERKEKLTEEEKQQLFYTEENILSDGIIRYSDDEVLQAYGLYADGELVGAVLDRDPILDAIEDIQNANLTGKPGERVEFDKSIDYFEGLYPVNTVMTSEELLEIITKTQTSDSTYIVQVGDTPSKIALQNSITRERLYQLNPDLEVGFAEGKELLVHKSAPFLSVRNIYIEIYDKEAPYRTVESENVTYAVGYRQVQRPGVPGIDRITAEVTVVDGEVINRNILESYHIRDPIEQLVTIGSRDPTQVPKSGGDKLFMWPAVGGYIGTPLGGYPGHSGVDINDSAGNVIASASGTVIKAEYSYVGYGIHVVLDHGNGYTTLYAHNTSLYVGVGDYVSQGQAIALLGSTGNSTGPHIHFEISQNGQIVNPAIFVGTHG